MQREQDRQARQARQVTLTVMSDDAALLAVARGWLHGLSYSVSTAQTELDDLVHNAFKIKSNLME